MAATRPGVSLRLSTRRLSGRAGFDVHAAGLDGVRAPTRERARRGTAAGVCENRGMTTDQIRHELQSVIDPELRRSIVELDMVRSIEIREGGAVDITVSL